MKNEIKSGHNPLIGTASLLLMSVIWGWAFVFQKMALTANLSATALIFSRFFIAAILFGIFGAKKIKQHYKPGQWRIGLLLSAIFFTASFIQILGLKQTTPGNSALITSANIIAVPFIGWIVTRKRPSKFLIACAVICFAGIGVLSVDTSQALFISSGNILTLLGALFYAVHLVAVGQSAVRVHFTVLAFMQFVFVSIISFVFVLFDKSSLSGFASTEGIVAIVYMGIVATCIGLTLQMFGQRSVSPTLAAIIVSSEALLGAVFSIMAGYDKPTWRLLIGGLIMFLSIVISNIWTQYQNRQNKKIATQKMNVNPKTRHCP